MANYEIPWAPPDISAGASMLIGVLNQNEANRRAEENAATQRMFAENTLKRMSAQEARDKQTFEEGHRKNLSEVIKSANELRRGGREGEANMLLKLWKVNAAPKIGAPEVVTPMSAAANLAPATAPVPEPGMPGSPFEGPASPEPPPLQVATPMMAASATQPRIEHGMGTSVPEEGPQFEPVSAADIEGIPPAPSAERDLMPITLPGKPTGAYSYTGPNGEDLGTFDPAQEEVFRQQRAGAANELYGGIDPKYGRIAQAMIVQGMDPQQVGKIIGGAIEHDTARQEAERVKIQDREDKQIFAEMMKKRYANEPITIADRDRWEAMRARAKAAAAGAGPTAPIVPELIRMAEEGAPLSEITTTAGRTPQKQYMPAIGQVVRNAAVGERAGEKRAALEVTDSKGNVLGTAHNSQQANTLKKQTDQFAQAKVRLEELIADIDAQGSRVLTPEQIQQRLSKAESVNAAMRVYNGLGATDASQQLEARITGAIGTPGHGFLMGANASIIRRILHEAEMQHDSRVKTALRAGGGRPLAPALGGPRRSKGDQTGGLTDDAAVQMARQRLATNPNDAVAKKVLELHGLAQ